MTKKIQTSSSSEAPAMEPSAQSVTRRSPYAPRRAAPSREPVVIARRPMKNGGASLVLRYRVGGKRTTEFLSLYLVPEVSRADKVKNLHTLEKAKLIQAERHVQLLRGDLATPQQVEQARVRAMSFWDWVADLMKDKRGTTLQAWQHALSYARRYDPRADLTLEEADSRWLLGFRNYLDTRAMAWSIDGRNRNDKVKGLEEGTKALYMRKISSALSIAYRQGFLAKDPTVGVPKFRPEEQDRVYLDISELRALVDTPFEVSCIKEAFLFCCLTGLRWSDMTKLRWDDITDTADGPTLVFKQTKTRQAVRVALNSQASKILDRMREISTGEEVFGLFMSDSTASYHLKVWGARAGITKNLSWHVSRHTFAMQLLDQGVELYTIAKLMGHRDIKTTQVYARIRDHHRRDAVDRLPDIL